MVINGSKARTDTIISIAVQGLHTQEGWLSSMSEAVPAHIFPCLYFWGQTQAHTVAHKAPKTVTSRATSVSRSAIQSFTSSHLSQSNKAPSINRGEHKGRTYKVKDCQHLQVGHTFIDTGSLPGA